MHLPAAVVVAATNTAPPLLPAQMHRALFNDLANRHMPSLGLIGAVAAAALFAFGEITDMPRLVYALGFGCWMVALAILWAPLSRGGAHTPPPAAVRRSLSPLRGSPKAKKRSRKRTRSGSLQAFRLDTQREFFTSGVVRAIRRSS